MNKDLLLLIKRIREAGDLKDLGRLKDLSESVLRNQKRDAILTLFAIAEELGEDEILGSLDELTHYLETMLKNRPKSEDEASTEE